MCIAVLVGQLLAEVRIASLQAELRDEQDGVLLQRAQEWREKMRDAMVSRPGYMATLQALQSSMRSSVDTLAAVAEANVTYGQEIRRMAQWFGAFYRDCNNESEVAALEHDVDLLLKKFERSAARCREVQQIVAASLAEPA